MSTIVNRIKSLRTYNNISQEQMAQLLDMSRITYANIESGKRELKKSELEKVASIFETTVTDFLSKEEEAPKGISSDHPLYKTIQTILYILSRTAGKPNVGKIVLNKLLYFADFNHYEKYWESITGEVYVKMPMGPVPKAIDGITSLMQQEGLLAVVNTKYHGYEQTRLLPLQSADTKVFSGTEIADLDDVIVRYGDKTGKRLTELSHGDAPWKATENIGDEISYGLVHYRTALYSVAPEESDD